MSQHDSSNGSARSGSARSGGCQRSGQWFLILIGLSLALIGAVFVWLMARSYLRARDLQAWPQVSCTILSSEVAERRHDPGSPLEFRHELSYGYEWQGRAHTSERFSLRGSKWSSHRDKAEESHRAYPVGSRHLCHVNPANPDQAVIKPDSLAPLYSIWFPGLFVVGGLGIVGRAIWAMSRD